MATSTALFFPLKGRLLFSNCLAKDLTPTRRGRLRGSWSVGWRILFGRRSDSHLNNIGEAAVGGLAALSDPPPTAVTVPAHARVSARTRLPPERTSTESFERAVRWNIFFCRARLFLRGAVFFIFLQARCPASCSFAWFIRSGTFASPGMFAAGVPVCVSRPFSIVFCPRRLAGRDLLVDSRLRLFEKTRGVFAAFPPVRVFKAFSSVVSSCIWRPVFGIFENLVTCTAVCLFSADVYLTRRRVTGPLRIWTG